MGFMSSFFEYYKKKPQTRVIGTCKGTTCTTLLEVLDQEEVDYDETWFTNSTDVEDRSSISGDSSSEEEELELVIRGLKEINHADHITTASRRRRLTIEQIGSTNSILEESKLGEGFPFKNSQVLVVESQDPFVDFRSSMAEMVASHDHGLTTVGKDWSYLKDLLEWYLRVNSEKSHQVIVDAFEDLILEIIDQFCLHV